MRRIESLEDRKNRVETYEFDDGRRITFDAYMIEQIGLAEAMRRAGVKLDERPAPVLHRGRRIGTVPCDFDPTRIKSLSFLYEPRPGDFVRRGDHWDAADTMMPGDFSAIPGFVWDKPASQEG